MWRLDLLAMAESKDTTSFFRKVVKFVANPATEWAEIDTPGDDSRENDYAKGELKAMIERKRRNDFVRKRELDMLRKVRREGLSSEQLAALGSSRIDSEPRGSDTPARQDAGVKAKIDEIEQQMVGDNYAGAPQRRTPEFYNAPTQPLPMEFRGSRGGATVATAAATQSGPADPGGSIDSATPSRASSAAPVPPPARVASMSPISLDMPPAKEFVQAFASVNAEVAHDPELDEAVIAFANADFEQCEQSLAALTSASGARAQHAETWLVLFDLYRATGQQAKFESLALDYAQQFGWSAPQWFSLPKLVAETAGDDRPKSSRSEGDVGWVCPSHLEAEGVSELASLTLQMPLPWIFDWSALQALDAEACTRLSELFRTWIPQDLDMRWLSGDTLLMVLQDAAPTGLRDADPAYWQLRLDALRMANRPDQFDEAAIDYCITYEVSPPSWEPASCVVSIRVAGQTTTAPPLSLVSDVSTSFHESQPTDAASVVEVATVELSGQLVGDIGAALKKMDAELGKAKIVNVSCAKLIRVDFIAAGDLLNWVLARRTENRAVSFVDSHRMVALFFGAMGINEHAAVKVRTF